MPRSKLFVDMPVADRCVCEVLRETRAMTVEVASQIAIASGGLAADQGQFIMDRLEAQKLAREVPGGYARGAEWFKAAAEFGWPMKMPLLEECYIDIDEGVEDE